MNFDKLPVTAWMKLYSGGVVQVTVLGYEYTDFNDLEDHYPRGNKMCVQVIDLPSDERQDPNYMMFELVYDKDLHPSPETLLQEELRTLDYSIGRRSKEIQDEREKLLEVRQKLARLKYIAKSKFTRLPNPQLGGRHALAHEWGADCGHYLFDCHGSPEVTPIVPEF